MIPIAKPILGKEEKKNAMEAIDSGWLSNGEFVGRFEDRFSSYCGRKTGIAVSNGTAALHLALKALGIGPGDEVIVPALSFIAVANSVYYCGAKPVFCDSDSEYWCISPEEIKKKITPKTKALIAAHLYGHPCDMKAIEEIAEKYNLKAVEDAAEAHGAECRGRKAGSFGDVSCFSFFGNKMITTGEGGMCLTDNPKTAEIIAELRDHGMSREKKYWHNVIGFNYRMTNVQAAIGLAQCGRLESLLEKKRAIASKYSKFLKNSSGIILPREMRWAKSSFWLYSVAINSENKTTEKIARSLAESGIETRPFFNPISAMPPYRSDERFPVAERLSARGLSLPTGPNITYKEIKFVADKLKSAVSV